MGDDDEVNFEDWLLTLERASTWNGWTSDLQIMQLAGHLRGRALQEWNLISQDERSTLEGATETTLRPRWESASCPGISSCCPKTERKCI